LCSPEERVVRRWVRGKSGDKAPSHHQPLHRALPVRPVVALDFSRRDPSTSLRVGNQKPHPEAAAEGSLSAMNKGRHRVCPYGETLRRRPALGRVSGWERERGQTQGLPLRRGNRGERVDTVPAGDDGTYPYSFILRLPHGKLHPVEGRGGPVQPSSPLLIK
jgi:hypothetical protein